jgi:hypothetical protein
VGPGFSAEDFREKLATWESDRSGLVNRLDDTDLYVVAHVFKLKIVLYGDDCGLDPDVRVYSPLPDSEPPELNKFLRAFLGDKMEPEHGQVEDESEEDVLTLRLADDGHVDLLVPKKPGRGGDFNVAQCKITLEWTPKKSRPGYFSRNFTHSCYSLFFGCTGFFIR